MESVVIRVYFLYQSNRNIELFVTSVAGFSKKLYIRFLLFSGRQPNFTHLALVDGTSPIKKSYRLQLLDS